MRWIIIALVLSACEGPQPDMLIGAQNPTCMLVCWSVLHGADVDGDGSISQSSSTDTSSQKNPSP